MNLTFGQVVHVEREDGGPLFDIVLDLKNLSTGAIHHATMAELASGILSENFSIGIIGTIPRSAITPIEPEVILDIKNIIKGIDQCLGSIGGIDDKQTERLSGLVGEKIIL